MRHTIVVEIPDSYEANSDWVERALTHTIEQQFGARVIQYHHEQITELLKGETA